MALNNVVIEVDGSTDEMRACIEQLNQALTASELQVPNAFLEAFDGFITRGDFCDKCFAVNSSAAVANKVLVTFKPTELFGKILAAVRAGDFDLSVFEV